MWVLSRTGGDGLNVWNVKMILIRWNVTRMIEVQGRTYKVNMMGCCQRRCKILYSMLRVCRGVEQMSV